MGSSPKQSTAPQTVNQTTTNIPAYAEPYVTRELARGEAVSNQGYQPYTGNRIAAFTPDQQQGFNLTNNLMPQTQSNYANAQNVAQGANYDPSQMVSNDWNPSSAQQYMNPYISNVLDTMMSRSQLNQGQQQNALKAQAVQAGTFGGARQGVQSAVAQDLGNRSLQEQMANLLQGGYNTAYNQFSTDRGSRLNTEQLNNTNSLAAANFGLDKSKSLGALAGQGLSDQQKIIQMMQTNGLDQQKQSQAALDLAYQDFANQRDYEKNNVSFMSNLIHGLPAASDQTVSSQVNTNPYSQALGLGISGVGLAKALGT